jgi:hypothetical protein
MKRSACSGSLVQHALGRHAELNAALQELIEKHAAGGAYQIAEAYAYCAETDLAFEWLERACTQRDPGTGMVRADPPLRSLSGDPRWQLFLEKMELSDRVHQAWQRYYRCDCAKRDQ